MQKKRKMEDLTALKLQFFELLDERQKRLYAALEAKQKGHYGVPQASELFGLHPNTIRKGKEELRELENHPLPAGKIRRPGSGRKKNNRTAS